MSSPLRLLVHGATGRMGAAVLRLAREDARFVVVAAVSRRPLSNEQDAALWIRAERCDEVPEFDVAIDFSLPSAFDRVLELCRARGAAFVSGTTGLESTQREALRAAERDIAVLWASNFSLGIAVLTELVERAARLLPGWDCDVLEAHHVHKRDAPSGTALSLGTAIENGRGRAPNYASLRAGDIVGEHTVQFSGRGERLELVHRATHRDVFALGALHAANAIASHPAGGYRLAQMLLAPD